MRNTYWFTENATEPHLSLFLHFVNPKSCHLPCSMVLLRMEVEFLPAKF
jgi:hypothetical protein